MYNGDFSNFRNASNAIIPIYDPLTQCGTAGNSACASGQTIQRQVFPGNIIPKNRFDPVGNALAAFPLMALPNQPGDAFTHNNNYSALASKGGDNDQVNGRLDYSVSDKLRLFARFSRWHSTNLPFAPFHNGIYANDPYAPEEFTTTQGVLGSTYLITPTPGSRSPGVLHPVPLHSLAVVRKHQPQQDLRFSEIHGRSASDHPQRAGHLHSQRQRRRLHYGERAAHSVHRKRLPADAQPELGEGASTP